MDVAGDTHHAACDPSGAPSGNFRMQIGFYSVKHVCRRRRGVRLEGSGAGFSRFPWLAGGEGES